MRSPDADPSEARDRPVRTSIAVCTYQRPRQLAGLLEQLLDIGPDPRWEIGEIVVVDNDPAGNALPVVQLFESNHGNRRFTYHHVPEPGVSNARNAALVHAKGDVLVFIDDDEQPAEAWPAGIIEPILDDEADLVSGPVLSVLPPAAPSWLSPFFQRHVPDSGPAHWLRSGNLAMNAELVRTTGTVFNQRFNETGGEDVAFTMELRARGLRLRWSASGSVHEAVSIDRCSPAWILDRERSASANFVRARRQLEPSIRVFVAVAPRVVINATLSCFLALAAARPSGTPQARLQARVRWARARGQLDGLRDRAGRQYGRHTPRPSGEGV